MSAMSYTEMLRKMKPIKGTLNFTPGVTGGEQHWVTIGSSGGHHGIHVMINGAGEISKGPHDLTGQNVSHLKGSEQHAPQKVAPVAQMGGGGAQPQSNMSMDDLLQRMQGRQDAAKARISPYSAAGQKQNAMGGSSAPPSGAPERVSPSASAGQVASATALPPGHPDPKTPAQAFGGSLLSKIASHPVVAPKVQAMARDGMDAGVAAVRVAREMGLFDPKPLTPPPGGVLTPEAGGAADSVRSPRVVDKPEKADAAQPDAEKATEQSASPDNAKPLAVGGAGQASDDQADTAAGQAGNVDKFPDSKIPTRPAKLDPKQYTKSGLQKSLMDYHQSVGVHNEIEDDKALAAYHHPYTFLRTDKTKSGFPGEIERFLEQPGHVKYRKMMELTDDPKLSQGSDALGDMGEEKYFGLLERRAQGKMSGALESAKNAADPEVRFLAAVHTAHEGLRAEGTKPGKPDVAAPGDLNIGHEFTVHGIPVRVTEDEDGQTVLRDGNDIPETPVAALSQVPMDKGSLKKGAEPEIGEGDPFGDVKGEAEPATQAASLATSEVAPPQPAPQQPAVTPLPPTSPSPQVVDPASATPSGGALATAQQDAVESPLHHKEARSLSDDELLKHARAGKTYGIKEAARRGLAEFKEQKPQRRWNPKQKWETESPDAPTAEDVQANYEDTHKKLLNEGHKLDKESSSRSRYYSHPDGALTRVSDHAPNAATQDWIDKNGVDEIRTDKKRPKPSPVDQLKSKMTGNTGVFGQPVTDKITGEQRPLFHEMFGKKASIVETSESPDKAFKRELAEVKKNAWGIDPGGRKAYLQKTEAELRKKHGIASPVESLKAKMPASTQPAFTHEQMESQLAMVPKIASGQKRHMELARQYLPLVK